jgi:hypothetical protein
MPYAFQNNQTKQWFGLLIFLNAPRKGCRSADVRDALYDTLDNFYMPNHENQRPLYDAYLQLGAQYPFETIKLDDSLENELGFLKVNTTLVLMFDAQFVDTDR